MALMVTSARGLSLIENAEGLKLKAYPDSKGVWTIGYGHTRGVHPGMTITPAQAHAYLRADLKIAETDVATLVNVPLTQNQFDALASFTFNLGRGDLATSTLLKKLNARDYAGAAKEFDRWIYCNGHVEDGLVTRRANERALFESPQTESSPSIDWMEQLVKTQRSGASHA